MSNLDAIAPDLRPLRRHEYEQLVALGAFEDERVELLHGVIVTRSPQSPRHHYVVRQLASLLYRGLDAERYEISVQGPFAALADSEPEPDLAVYPAGTWRDEHPSGALLVIEVADSSLQRDVTVKVGLYAAAGVREYWVVDLVDELVEVWRDPVGGRFAVHTRVEADGTLVSAVVPGVVVELGRLFGS